VSVLAIRRFRAIGCAMKTVLVAVLAFAARALLAGEAENRPAELVREYSGSLFFVEDKSGAGSGFVCSILGRKFALTNQHVVAGHQGANLTLLDRSLLKVGQAAAAVGHDIMSLAVLSDTKAMEMMLDVEKNAAIGDEVVVLGNPEGARVIKPLVGKLVGIGPNLVEVTAEFVPGNSGSPILHLKSGKVIGVATYLTLRDMGALSGGSAPKVRRFGYRLDSVRQWQPVVWPVYAAEFQAIGKIQERTHDLAGLLRELMRTGRVNAAHFQNPAIRRPLEKFDEAAAGKALVPTDRARAAKDLIGAMRTACESDIADANARMRYDFFRKLLGEEQQVREQFYKVFDEILKAQGK